MADALPFSHLRVAGSGSLNVCELFNLGRVNVICGRNNSGKSTLLAGIVNPTMRQCGVVFGEEHIDDLTRDLYQTGPWRKTDPPGNSKEWPILRGLVAEAVGKPKPWFIGELMMNLREQIAALDRESGLQHLALDIRIVETEFKDWTHIEAPSALVSRP